MASKEPKPPLENLSPAFRPGLEYLAAVILSWLVPGAGHWILGQRVRAVLLAVLLLGTFWWGETMASGWAVTRKEHEIFFLGQIGNGLSAILANFYENKEDVKPNVGGNRPVGERAIDRKIPSHLSIGILLTCISGLLNLLLVLHTMDPRSWQERPSERPMGGPGSPRTGP